MSEEREDIIVAPGAHPQSTEETWFMVYAFYEEDGEQVAISGRRENITSARMIKRGFELKNPGVEVIIRRFEQHFTITEVL